MLVFWEEGILINDSVPYSDDFCYQFVATRIDFLYEIYEVLNSCFWSHTFMMFNVLIFTQQIRLSCFINTVIKACGNLVDIQKLYNTF